VKVTRVDRGQRHQVLCSVSLGWATVGEGTDASSSESRCQFIAIGSEAGDRRRTSNLDGGRGRLRGCAVEYWHSGNDNAGWLQEVSQLWQLCPGLGGARLVLCPDRDQVGMAHMEEIAQDFPDRSVVLSLSGESAPGKTCPSMAGLMLRTGLPRAQRLSRFEQRWENASLTISQSGSQTLDVAGLQGADSSLPGSGSL
jgi:hypothetical protein